MAPQKRKEVVRNPDGTIARGSAAMNPGGRPKEAAEVKALSREHGPHAIERLAELVDCDDERIAVAACREILDRAYGRPTQKIRSLLSPFPNYLTKSPRSRQRPRLNDLPTPCSLARGG
jgi:hypothetical protein